MGKPGVVRVVEYYKSVKLNSNTVSAAEDNARKVDFSNILCKSLVKEDSGIIPSWTAFNTKLDNEPKSLSNITYNAPITEISTVHTILKKCTEMVNKLSLQCAVVVFDEAVYCKAQMIRWKNQEFLNHLVVRLGEFHMAMSFCSGIAKIFKDGGLQVSIFT